MSSAEDQNLSDAESPEEYAIGDLFVSLSGILWVGGYLASLIIGLPISLKSISAQDATQIVAMQLHYMDLLGMFLYTTLILLLLWYQGNRALWMSFRGLMLLATLAVFMLANFFLDLFVIGVDLFDSNHMADTLWLLFSPSNLNANRQWLYVFLALVFHFVLLALILLNLYHTLRLALVVDRRASSEAGLISRVFRTIFNAPRWLVSWIGQRMTPYLKRADDGDFLSPLVDFSRRFKMRTSHGWGAVVAASKSQIARLSFLHQTQKESSNHTKNAQEKPSTEKDAPHTPSESQLDESIKTKASQTSESIQDDEGVQVPKSAVLPDNDKQDWNKNKAFPEVD